MTAPDAATYDVGVGGDLGGGAAVCDSPEDRRRRRLGYGLLALLAYVPILLTKPGRVVADTKTYLYLDPGRLLERAFSMWDPNIGMGTLTHQNIGYLFPMGPYYWLMHLVGVPAWVSQRLWLGSIFFAAALGMLFLLRTLRVRGPGAPVAAVLFMLSPYALDFSSRISVILLPWAGLPWLLALTIRALRSPDARGRWRYAAIFAIVVQVIGGVNATSLVFAGLAPVLWIVYDVVTREVDWRRALGVTVRIGVLTLLTSLWWIAGLWAQGSYGLNVLKFTETLQAVSTTSTATEVLRGLGYWFFYGRDRLSQWTEASVPYGENPGLIVVSFALPVLALFGAACIRWRHRAYFVVLTFVGVVVAVGANPYDDPSLVGSAFKSFAESSSFGLALRSTSRAVPLVALGFAALLGVAVNSLARAWAEVGPRSGRRVAGIPVPALAVAAGVVVLAVLNLPALWTGGYYTDSLTRDETIPQAWTDAIANLDAQSHDTRVLELPGSDFAAYRWGQTVDPITPGLMDRPYVARELVPWGSNASTDLLIALDQRLQEGTLEPSALAPVARLLAAGDILYRADLQTDRYGLARAVPVWQLLTDPLPPGVAAPEKFGTSLGPHLEDRPRDEQALAQTPGLEKPPPVSIFRVANPKQIVRSADASAPVIVSGDGEALVDLASIGGLPDRGVVLYSATFAGDQARLKAQIAQPGSVLVVSDSNRKRARRWNQLSDTYGATERVDQQALRHDESDNRLDEFPDAGYDAYTVVTTPGVKVDTTSYGNPSFYEPDRRGSRAFDGDLSTGWTTAADFDAIGERLRLELDQPITTGQIGFVVPDLGPNRRFVTAVDLSFDGGAPIRVPLDDSSRTAAGQTVTFPKQTFSRLDVTIADTNTGHNADPPNYNNNVGFSEIRLRDDAPGAQDIRVDEIVRMPTDLVDVAGATAADRPLVYQMNRERDVVIPPRTSQDEVALVREFRVPDARAFGMRGTARLDPQAADDLIDRLLGIPSAANGGVTVTSSEKLEGSLSTRGSSAIDGDPRTAWQTTIDPSPGQWVDVATAQPVTFDHLDLQVVSDGRHSVPTKLQIDAGGQSRTVDLPRIPRGKFGDPPVKVPVSFPALTGSDVRVTVLAQRDFKKRPLAVGLAELGIPGVTRPAMPVMVPSDCRADLVTVDGAHVPVQLVGTAADAAAGKALDLRRCPDAAATTTLGAGDHLLRSAEGVPTGIDVDRMVLGSEAGGAAMVLGPNGELPTSVTQVAAHPAATPMVKVTSKGSTKLELQVSGARKGTPFWLVLGQSNNAGWQATVDGKVVGGSTLVDGYANGWLVRPPSGSFTVTLRWTPQRVVWIALGVSAVALLVCLVLALRRRKRPSLHGPDRSDALAVARVDDLPVLANPLVAVGDRPRVSAVVGGALAVGIAGALVSRWWVGVLAAALVALVAYRPRLRYLLTLGAPLALGVAALYVVVQQLRYEFLTNLAWPGHFTKVSNLAWLAVVLLLGDVVVETLRRRAELRAAAGAREPT